MPVEAVRPCRRVRVLEIGHEAASARVQGVDDHLPVDRAGDLAATVLQIGRDRRDPPVALASVPGLEEEVGELAGGNALLPFGARGEEALPFQIETALKARHELECFLGENLCVSPLDGRANV